MSEIQEFCLLLDYNKSNSDQLIISQQLFDIEIDTVAKDRINKIALNTKRFVTLYISYIAAKNPDKEYSGSYILNILREY